MNNIYTICEELLTRHGDEEFEPSEMADLPILSFTVDNKHFSWQGDVSDEEAMELVEKYKLLFLMKTFDVDLTIMGYVHNKEFFVFATFLKGEDGEMSPTRRSDFMQLFNTNREDVKLRHVPGLNGSALRFDGASRALAKGSKMKDVVKYTIQSLVELSGGISPMTGIPRKGFIFKSLTSDYKFKVYSESALMLGSL